MKKMVLGFIAIGLLTLVGCEKDDTDIETKDITQNNTEDSNEAVTTNNTETNTDVSDEDETGVTVEVSAAQWYWGFNYGYGYEKPEEFTKCSSNINCIEVPANSIIRFNITAQDVLHAFYLPEMGIKQDAVPGLDTVAWVDTSIVEARDEPYSIYCTEYCGNSHSMMLAEIYVTEL